MDPLGIPHSVMFSLSREADPFPWQHTAKVGRISLEMALRLLPERGPSLIGKKTPHGNASQVQASSPLYRVVPEMSARRAQMHVNWGLVVTWPLADGPFPLFQYGPNRIGGDGGSGSVSF